MIELVPSEKTVYLVNIRTPEPLQDINNDLLAEAADAYENVHLIDWFSYSAGHDEWFDGDGTHLKPSGCEKYLEMIQRTLVAAYEKEAALKAAEESTKPAHIAWDPFIGAEQSAEEVPDEG